MVPFSQLGKTEGRQILEPEVNLESYYGCIKFEVAYWRSRASLVAQMVKRLCAMQETRVQSLGWDDPLEKEMAAHSSILAWKIPWIEDPNGLQSIGSQRVGHN